MTISLQSTGKTSNQLIGRLFAGSLPLRANLLLTHWWVNNQCSLDFIVTSNLNPLTLSSCVYASICVITIYSNTSPQKRELRFYEELFQTKTNCCKFPCMSPIFHYLGIVSLPHLTYHIFACSKFQVGWRTEFRSLEVQLTDAENAAFISFVVLVTRVVLAFDLNLYIPLSKVSQSLRTLHKSTTKLGLVLDRNCTILWWRCVFSRHCSKFLSLRVRNVTWLRLWTCLWRISVFFNCKSIYRTHTSYFMQVDENMRRAHIRNGVLTQVRRYIKRSA